MAYEPRDNSGSMFINDKKTKDTHPDYQGKIMVSGVMYYVSSWYKKLEGKKAFFSMALKPVDDVVAPAQESALTVCVPELPVVQQQAATVEEDDLPF